MSDNQTSDDVAFDINAVLDGLAIENGRLRAQLLVARARIDALLAQLPAQPIAQEGVEDSAEPEPQTQHKSR